VQLSFLVTIIDDNIPEENEVFQVVLQTPNGGGSVGAQFRANVTILDDDLHKLQPKLTFPTVDYVTTVAGQSFMVPIQARAATGQFMSTGGDRFLSIVENDLNSFTGRDPLFGSQRATNRAFCKETYVGNGAYQIVCPAIEQQGSYQLRIFHAFPQTIKGQYYNDGFFQNLALTRLDQNVNFTWGTGRLMPRGSDYISIRWTGALLTKTAGQYFFKVNADDHARLWMDGKLLLDHFHERAVNLESPFPITLEAATLYEIILEYREVNGDAYASLLWKSPADNKFSVITSDNLFSLFEIDRSPVIIRVQSTETAAVTTECTGDGLYSATALHPSYFQFCPRDMYGNLRDDGDEFYLGTQTFSSTFHLIDSGSYHGVGSEHLTPMISYDPSTHCWDGQYVPEIAGLYNLNIYYQSLNSSVLSHVVGSPFIVPVSPDRASGPLSDVHDLPHPLQLEAGNCATFTIILRDNALNFRRQGGDSVEVYAYRVDYNRQKGGREDSPTKMPTFVPTVAPTYAANHEISADTTGELAVIRYGIVTDLNNGNYSVQICPIISGTYELHLLLRGRGISNQNFRLLDTAVSLKNPLGKGSYYGQYIASSPYSLVVSHTQASVITSTVQGDGLTTATVGVTASFMLTVRDPYDNVLVDDNLLPTIAVKLDKSPSATVHVWNYHNGSYLLQYAPLLSGTNILSVSINGNQILGSPFYVETSVGVTTEVYSYAEGSGLHHGMTGKVSYFTLYSYDLSKNRKTDYNDKYFFEVSGANTITGYMQPCPYPRVPDHPVCNVFDEVAGYYWGQFVPKFTGVSTISVFLNDSTHHNQRKEITNSSFHALIVPSEPKAEFTDVFGVLYENIAGVPATISLQLRDYFHNKLISGGYDIDTAILGVGVEWGTQQPWNTSQGLANQYNYKGFYHNNHYPTFYADAVVDHLDGSYLIKYNVNISGEYVLRLSLAEAGLNLTLFNDTHFGYLYNDDSYSQDYVNSLLGRPVNYGTTLSWTGDIGGPASAKGDLGHSSYFDRYYSKNVPILSVNATRGMSSYLRKINASLQYNFREEYWSARWKGMITPLYAEIYKFIIVKDSNSELNLWIGGLGIETNQSYYGSHVINSSAGVQGNTLTGYYHFTDTKHREFLLEFQHFTKDAFLEIYWESVSTPRALIPSTAFTHWRNISHYNLTIYPTDLCAHCSVAWGKAQTTAQVGRAASFLVYARDRYNNLIQHGGHQPTMVAVGKNGIAFRGKVTDYQNGTYLVQYYPTQSGTYRMYVSVGSGVPNAGVGYPKEIQLLKPFLVSGTPFELVIDPALIEPSRSIATGNGLVGTNAGEIASFTIFYRDIFNNPTHVQSKQEVNGTFLVGNTMKVVDLTDLPLINIQFYNTIKQTYYQPEHLQIQQISHDKITYEYEIQTAGSYHVQISISMDNSTNYYPIVGSPFALTVNPVEADPSKTVSRGNGLRFGSIHQLSHFEIQLYDRFGNKLITGGNRFSIRLYGDSDFKRSKQAVVPTYTDTQNGRYIVSYRTSYLSKHLLSIKLLKGDMSHPGGRGLNGYYYNNYDGAVNNPGSSMGPGIKKDDQNLLYQQIDRKVSFSWMNGFILSPSHPNSDNLLSKVNILRNLGQSVRWQGYLVAPRNDEFFIYANVQNMNVTIFIDQELVFDSLHNIRKSLPLTGLSAYEIIVLAQVRPTIMEKDVISIDLKWSSWNIQDQIISSFFLYDSAEEVQFSPFQVEVSPDL
jgi:hypothetical protein